MVLRGPPALGWLGEEPLEAGMAGRQRPFVIAVT